MMKSDEPTMQVKDCHSLVCSLSLFAETVPFIVVLQHVGMSYKIKRLIQSLRRYAWDMRQLMQELKQNQQVRSVPGCCTLLRDTLLREPCSSQRFQ